MTDRGRAEDERRMAAELDAAGARDSVTAVHAQFVDLNRRFTTACPDWQIRPTHLDRMDWGWDERGERRRVDAPEIDSCHAVWVQLREDLLSKLGLVRGSDT